MGTGAKAAGERGLQSDEGGQLRSRRAAAKPGTQIQTTTMPSFATYLLLLGAAHRWTPKLSQKYCDCASDQMLSRKSSAIAARRSFGALFPHWRMTLMAIVHGMAYEVQSPEEVNYLQAYETDKSTPEGV